VLQSPPEEKVVPQELSYEQMFALQCNCGWSIRGCPQHPELRAYCEKQGRVITDRMARIHALRDGIVPDWFNQPFWMVPESNVCYDQSLTK